MLTPLSKPRTELQKAVTHPHPVDLVELQRSLRADEVLLEYVLAEPRSFCLHVTRRTATVSALSAGRKQIEGLVDSYRGAIGSMKPGRDAAEKLYSILLRPVPGGASKLRLLIVPDGRLNPLPFESLQDSAGRYVLNSHVVTYAPSAGRATNLWVQKSTCHTRLPEPFPTPTHLGTSQRDYGVGATDGPMHAGQLEALPEDGLAPGLHHARAHE